MIVTIDLLDHNNISKQENGAKFSVTDGSFYHVASDRLLVFKNGTFSKLNQSVLSSAENSSKGSQKYLS